jgi:hypothetical protein
MKLVDDVLQDAPITTTTTTIKSAMMDANHNNKNHRSRRNHDDCDFPYTRKDECSQKGRRQVQGTFLSKISSWYCCEAIHVMDGAVLSSRGVSSWPGTASSTTTINKQIDTPIQTDDCELVDASHIPQQLSTNKSILPFKPMIVNWWMQVIWMHYIS